MASSGNDRWIVDIGARAMMLHLYLALRRSSERNWTGVGKRVKWIDGLDNSQVLKKCKASADEQKELSDYQMVIYMEQWNSTVLECSMKFRKLVLSTTALSTWRMKDMSDKFELPPGNSWQSERGDGIGTSTGRIVRWTCLGLRGMAAAILGDK